LTLTRSPFFNRVDLVVRKGFQDRSTISYYMLIMHSLRMIIDVLVHLLCSISRFTERNTSKSTDPYLYSRSTFSSGAIILLFPSLYI
jgi:hypothetical protein